MDKVHIKRKGKTRIRKNLPQHSNTLMTCISTDKDNTINRLNSIGYKFTKTLKKQNNMLIVITTMKKPCNL